MNAEQLRESWKSKQYASAFNPDEPNFSDLMIKELEPALTSTLAPEGFKVITAAETPTVLHFGPKDERFVYGVKTIEALPEAVQNCGILMTAAQIMEQWLIPSSNSEAIELLDPEDRLYFIKNDEVFGGPVLLGFHHKLSYLSDYWERFWTMQMDTMFSLGDNWPDFSPERVRPFTLPQAVERQHEDPIYKVGIINRESTTEGRDRISPFLNDGYVFYSQYVTVIRGNNYPFPEGIKPNLTAAIANVVRNSTLYDINYRDRLIEVHKMAKSQGIDLQGTFAAKQL